MRVGWISVAVIVLGCGSTSESESGGAQLPDAGDGPGMPPRGEPSSATEASTRAPADAGPFGFRRDVYPIFAAYCGQCHSVNGPYHDIASPELDEAYADSVEFAERIVARIAQGNMPPGCVFDDSACVPPADLETIERWIAEGLPE
jgi:hypothetical protein